MLKGDIAEGRRCVMPGKICLPRLVLSVGGLRGDVRRHDGIWLKTFLSVGTTTASHGCSHWRQMPGANDSNYWRCRIWMQRSASHVGNTADAEKGPPLRLLHTSSQSHPRGGQFARARRP